MSATIMTRRCDRCHRTYTYNPSVGKLGKICPYCGKVQPLDPTTKNPLKSAIPILLLWQIRRFPRPRFPWEVPRL